MAFNAVMKEKNLIILLNITHTRAHVYKAKMENCSWFNENALLTLWLLVVSVGVGLVEQIRHKMFIFITICIYVFSLSSSNAPHIGRDTLHELCVKRLWLAYVLNDTLKDWHVSAVHKSAMLLLLLLSH